MSRPSRNRKASVKATETEQAELDLSDESVTPPPKRKRGTKKAQDDEDFGEESSTKARKGKGKGAAKSSKGDADDEADSPAKGKATKGKKKAAKKNDDEEGSAEPAAKAASKSGKRSTVKTGTASKKVARTKKKATTRLITQAQHEAIAAAAEECQSMTADALKAHLLRNNMKRTGTKSDLVARVSQAMVLGAIPTCPSCGGGKPDFNIATEMYSCPGYFDDTDFQRCFRKFGFSDITRGPWLA